MDGAVLEEGQYVVYGKSCRYQPIAKGTIMKITDEDIHILADGAKRVSRIPTYHSDRVVVIFTHGPIFEASDDKE